jgi:hypothetical protein
VRAYLARFTRFTTDLRLAVLLQECEHSAVIRRHARGDAARPGLKKKKVVYEDTYAVA